MNATTKYVSPRPQLGQTVLWYSGLGGTEPRPALVAALGTDTIDVCIIVSDSGTFLCRGGVRHAANPDQEKIRNADVGIWDFLPAEAADLAGVIQAQHDSLVTLGAALVAVSERLVRIETALAGTPAETLLVEPTIAEAIQRPAKAPKK